MANRTADINNGSQVKFLLGTQADLEPYIKGTSKAVNGTFYLTNDSHRLYVGNKDGKAVPVNEGVTTVENLTLLQTTYATAHPGEFFYITDSNILCVCAGEEDGSKKFVQINNNTDSYVTTADTTISVSGSEATIGQVLTRNDAIKVNDSFKIATAEGIKVSVSEDKKTLTLTGTTNDNFAFTVTSDGANATAVLTLTDTNGDNIEATIKTDRADLLQMSKDDTGALVLTPKDQKPTALDLKATATGFSAVLTNHDGMTIEDTIEPQIKIGVEEANQETVNFINGLATLNVYSKKDIDAKMKALNAMTYKGLVKSDGSTSSATSLKWSQVVNNSGPKVSVGDVYLFLDNITFTQTGSTTEETYTAGTLAIAKSSVNGEDSDGYLSGTIDWDYVESTNDTDTTYALGLNNKIVQLKEFKGDVTNVVGAIEFANGDNITADVSNTGTADNINAKIVFNHNKLNPTIPANIKASQEAAAINAANVASTSTTVNVLDSIELDAYGHVNKIQTKEVTLLDTNSTINKFADSVAVASNVATITSGLQLMHGNSMVGTEQTASFKVASNNLTLSASDNTLTIDLVWGTF